MANGAWGDYLTLLGRVTRALEELTGVEQEKIRAVNERDLPAVEQCMKKEQVCSLNLRGLDQKREKLMDQLGMRGVPLREIMSRCPPGAEQETKEAAEALRRQYAIFQTTSEASRNALEIHLHIIEELHKRAGGGELPHQDAPPMKADFRA
ncbi:MAG: flagellar protein FlgN [Oscillospiraceae bacterium]|nr:flagellar protein FlgN [Oscillospiraceae bacterium]